MNYAKVAQAVEAAVTYYRGVEKEGWEPTDEDTLRAALLVEDAARVAVQDCGDNACDVCALAGRLWRETMMAQTETCRQLTCFGVGYYFPVGIPAMLGFSR